MNWAYALLGVSADADAITIKRAYARLLRTTRPDDDAAAFQRLNTAYHMVLSHAAQRPLAPASTPATSPPAADFSSGAASTLASPAPLLPLPVPTETLTSPAPTASVSLEVLKPPTPPVPALSARPLETLRPAQVIQPTSPPAPLEVLKPVTPVPKTDARPLEILRPPAPKPIPAVSIKDLAERAIREASSSDDPQQFSRWLHQYPEFWSFQVKQATGHGMLQQLLREPQPMAAVNLDVLLRFFDLDHVLSGVNPVALEQLRNKQALQWEMLHDQAALARRLRILTRKGSPYTLRVRDCIQQLKQPLRWQQTIITAMTRGKALHMARLVYALCNGQFTALPYAFDREHAQFWFCAAGVNGINRQRVTINAIRACAFALACATGFTLLMMLLSLQDDQVLPNGWRSAAALFGAVLGSIVVIWAAVSGVALMDQWQRAPETTALRKPWLRRLFIPALGVLGLGVDYLGDAPIAGSIIVWGAMMLAVRRFVSRSPKRVKISTFNLSPRAFLYILGVGTVGIANAMKQIPGGTFDDVPLLGVAACATLVMWGIDMWRHRTHLRFKPAN